MNIRTKTICVPGFIFWSRFNGICDVPGITRYPAILKESISWLITRTDFQDATKFKEVFVLITVGISHLQKLNKILISNSHSFLCPAFQKPITCFSTIYRRHQSEINFVSEEEKNCS